MNDLKESEWKQGYKRRAELLLTSLNEYMRNKALIQKVLQGGGLYLF